MEENNNENQEVIGSVEESVFPKIFDFNFLKDRAGALLFADAQVWQKIKFEKTEPMDLLKFYFAPLLAVAILANFFSQIIHTSFGTALITSIFYGILGFVCVYGSAILMDKFALDFLTKHSPKFREKKDRKTGEVEKIPLADFYAELNFEDALKTIVYAFTPLYVSCITLLIPSLAMIICSAAALYSAYNIYLGLPVMTNVVQDHRMRLVGAFCFMVFATFAVPVSLILPIFLGK